METFHTNYPYLYFTKCEMMTEVSINTNIIQYEEKSILNFCIVWYPIVETA